MSELKNLPADWRKGRKPHDNYTNAGRYPKGSTGNTPPTKGIKIDVSDPLRTDFIMALTPTERAEAMCPREEGSLIVILTTTEQCVSCLAEIPIGAKAHLDRYQGNTYANIRCRGCAAEEMGK